MVNPFYILAGCAIFLIYSGLNYYIGLRGWQALFSCVPLLTSKVYWTYLLVWFPGPFYSVDSAINFYRR